MRFGRAFTRSRDGFSFRQWINFVHVAKTNTFLAYEKVLPAKYVAIFIDHVLYRENRIKIISKAVTLYGHGALSVRKKSKGGSGML